MDSKSDQAVACFNSGFNCSQSVFSTYCEQLGMDKETGLKLSCAFGGGMGHIGETCGAVTGALMLIGLKYGKFEVEDLESKEITYNMVHEFATRFKAINGSVRCKDLLTVDIGVPEELQLARDRNLFKTLCPKYIKDAVVLIEEMLEL